MHPTLQRNATQRNATQRNITLGVNVTIIETICNQFFVKNIITIIINTIYNLFIIQYSNNIFFDLL